MDKKILILGKGYFGSRIRENLDAEISEKRINSVDDVIGEIKKYRTDILINCIGHTGKFNVDGCEEDKERTLTANTYMPLVLAEGALRAGIKYIHISSGCIFHYNYDKDQPIDDDKTPDFLDLFYSRSKIYAELALTPLLKKHNILILRVRIPLDNRPHPKNLIDKLTKYGKVIDAPNSVTYIPDFLKALKHLIGIDAKGTFNIVNEGGLYFPDLMEVYKKYVPDFKYSVINFKTLNMARTNLIMSTRKLRESGFTVRPIKDVLEECVKEYLNV